MGNRSIGSQSDSKHKYNKYGMVNGSGMTSAANDSRRERVVPIQLNVAQFHN